MSATETNGVREQIAEILSSLRLPTLATQMVARLEQAGHADLLPLMLEILELEVGDRRERRIERLMVASKLPPGKTFDTLKEERFPRPLLQQIREIARGQFLDRAANVLAFGLPGVGKSHVAVAIGHALVE